MKYTVNALTLIVGSLCVASLASVDSAADQIDFHRDIVPILRDHCWHCHGEGEQESGLRLDRRAAMLRGGDYGQPTIVPGEPDKSYLIEVVDHRAAGIEMPPDADKLPKTQIALLTRWIREGAVWPGQMDAVVQIESDHWSFQPIERPDVPQVAVRSAEGLLDLAHARRGQQRLSAIDAFLLDRLRKENLTFSKPADPRSLIRRVSIVLTGLAPTPDETRAFAKAYIDDSDQAYEQLVDRLLASPHFGERWAQHWLDVIRWAETNGSESNLYRKNAWIYRDYVIRSFNEDKPYAQFLFEQIAGDTVGAGEALGYLVSGPHVPVATVGQEPAARRQARADRMDEILQTVGASALGVTVGCARCHNHKFDPISIRDYYSMSAVFQDIEFGSRFPELAVDHPRRLRGNELQDLIAQQRATLRRTGFWEEDWTGYKELHFPAVTTRSVRISFMRAYARIDELEIFSSAQRDRNLALASEGTTVESPQEMAVVRSELHKINDGWYGTEAWAGRVPKDSTETLWVQFTFAEPHEVNRIRLSTNREDFLETDYLEGMNPSAFSPYKVDVQDADGRWQQVAATNRVQQLGQYARNCILARRLLERGVRVVQLFNGSDPSGGNGVTNWDSHSNILKTHAMQAEIMDQPTAALIADLKQRGLLEHTLVVWATEFGRMPFLQANGTGRDHNPDAFTCFLTGAGVKRGFSFGESDEFGFKAAVNMTTVYDFNATLLHLMGLDHERLTFYHNGLERRLTNVHGHVIQEVLA